MVGGFDSKSDESRKGGRGRPANQAAPPVSSAKVKAEELAKRTGVPPHVALRVVRGELELNDALKQLALQDEVTALVARHSIERALAMQVALGHANLEQVLRRRRVEAHLDEHQAQDFLNRAALAGTELVLGVYGRQLLRVRVLSQSAYEVQLMDLESKTTLAVHKTRIKFACDAQGWQKGRKAMTWDAERKAQTREPILKPQERFGCSNRRLGEVWDAKCEVVAVCVEGECFQGQVSYVARWEFGLRTKSGAEVVLFRHALADFKEL